MPLQPGIPAKARASEAPKDEATCNKQVVDARRSWFQIEHERRQGLADVLGCSKRPDHKANGDECGTNISKIGDEHVRFLWRLGRCCPVWWVLRPLQCGLEHEGASSWSCESAGEPTVLRCNVGCTTQGSKSRPAICSSWTCEAQIVIPKRTNGRNHLTKLGDWTHEISQMSGTPK